MHRLQVLLVKLLFYTAPLITPSYALPFNERRALTPDVDPFYQPPTGFESSAPGAILRQRQVAVSFFGLIPNPVQAWQLLYRSTAINGSAIADVTTVFKPSSPLPDRFVSFHTAYDSSAPICDPSYGYLLGSPQEGLIASVEELLIEAYLLSGYIVAAPDYEGPDVAFAAGRLEGTGVLDGIRAVANFGSTLGFSTSTPAVVGVGYSGGAIATGWAASLQPTYAPELNIKGWVAGGTPANLTGTLVFVDDTLFSGFLPAAVDGLNKPSSYAAQLSPVINSIITAEGQQVLDFANANCAPADLVAFPEKSILSTDFQTLGRDLLYQPTIAGIMSQLTMGVNKTETPTAPVLIYHATKDEVIPYANASTLVKAWCNNGASVNFTTFAAGGHVTTEPLGLPLALDFVSSAFAGTLSTGCSSSTVLDEQLNPVALGVDLEPVLLGLVEKIAHAGKQDSNIFANLNVLTGT